MPLLWLSIAFLAGLLLGAAVPPVWPGVAAASAGLLVVAFFERRIISRFPWYPPWRDLSHLPRGREWRYGDRILLWGAPQEPEIEGAPFYHDSLARQGIHTQLSFPGSRLAPPQLGRAGKGTGFGPRCTVFAPWTTAPSPACFRSPNQPCWRASC